MPASPEWVRLITSQLWQVTLLIPLAILVLRLVGRRRSHLSYAVLLVVLVKCVTPPVFISAIGAFSWMESAVQEAPRQEKQLNPVRHVAVSEASVNHAKVEPAPVVAAELPAALPSPPKATIKRPEIVERPQPSMPVLASVAGAWPLFVLGAYVLGLIVMAGWLMKSRWRLQRLLAATRTPDTELTDTCDELSQRIGLRRAPQLRITADTTMPMALGIVRPTIIIPEFVVESAEAQEMELILAHELNHFRRRDTAVGALQLGVQILWWFHPFVWWLNRELRRLREQCCDEEVLARLECRPHSYAHCLLNVLELNERCSPSLALAGMSPFEVTSRRLRNIMRPSGAFPQQTPKWCWGAALASAALVLPGASATTSSGSAASENPIASSTSADPTGGAEVQREPDAVTAEIIEEPLRYRMPPGTRYAYRVSIEVEYPDHIETHFGAPAISVRDARDGTTELVLNSHQLHVTRMPKPDQWPPVIPISRPPSLDPFSVAVPRVVRIDERGRIAAEQGNTEVLPLFLGSLVDLLLPGYPDAGLPAWQTVSSKQLQIETTPESEAVRVLSMLTEPEPELVAADELVRYEIQSVDGDHATIAKQWDLESLQTVRGEPRIESTGDGTMVVNAAGGHVESLEFRATVTLRESNVATTYPVVMTVELTDYQRGDLAEPPATP